jgi:hypothetical protein
MVRDQAVEVAQYFHISMVIEWLRGETRHAGLELDSNWTVGIRVLRNTSIHFGLAKKSENM